MATEISTLSARLFHGLCWDFETALQNGQCPRIEDWLQRRGDIPADRLFEELMQVELEVKNGFCFRDVNPALVPEDTVHESPTLLADLDHYLERFPQHSHAIASVTSRIASRKRAELGTVGDSIEESLPQLNDGRYDFIKEEARGGSCKVWRVFDNHLKRHSAIKLLLQSQDNPEMRARIEKEARICARLQHPGIVPIYELGHFENGSPFVAMKLIEGQTFAEVLDSKPPTPVSDLLDVFGHVCEAVSHAHSSGIVHRDLKPSNIMVGQHGEVQVMDWGLAKDLNRAESVTGDTHQRGSEDFPNSLETIIGSVLGTVAYMPPEQANGHTHKITTRSDVFALGGILCKILTGQATYAAQTTGSLLELAQKGDIAFAVGAVRKSKANRLLKNLAIRCLSPEAMHRPSDATAVLAEFSDCTRPKRWLQRWLWLAMAFLGSVLAFMLIEFVVMWNTTTAELIE